MTEFTKPLTPHSEAMSTLCRALKLPKDTRGFSLQCKSVFDLPVVTAEYHPQNDSDVEASLNSLEYITKDFVLMPKDQLEALNREHEKRVEELCGQVEGLRDVGSPRALMNLLEQLRWRDFIKEPPPIGRYVEALRRSGYAGLKFEILTAKYDPEYKGWTDLGNDRITDSGYDPIFWRPYPDLTHLLEML